MAASPDAQGGLPLDLDPDQRAALNQAVIEYLDRFFAERGDLPASWPEPDLDHLDALRAPPPEVGGPIGPLLERLDLAIDTGINSASGRFLSYIPNGRLYSGALATFIGAAINQYTGATHASPGSIVLEHSVVEWLLALFGLPASGSGVLLSGGSVANLTGVITARTRLGEDFRSGTLYTSVAAHHSVDKAARIAGIGSDRVRAVPVDRQLRLDVDRLHEMIEADRAAGLTPMLVVATAGTTDAGAIDPLEPMADLASRFGASFHVDAAYGGFFQLTERGRARLTGIERADTVTVDVHKSMFAPFGLGALLARDRDALVGAHDAHGSYMRDVGDQGLPHYFARGPELTRPFRGLAAWLPLHLHGVAAFRDTLDEMLDLAAWTAAELSALDGVELAVEPTLSVVVVRATAGDDATQRMIDHLNNSREIHVSSTSVAGQLAVRFAFLSPQTSHEVARRAVQLVAEAVAER